MPENIIIQAGQCGNQIAHKFWKLAELENTFQQQSSTFFYQSKPRAVLIDMEPAVLSNLTNKNIEQHQVISDNPGSGNNFAQAYKQHAQTHHDRILESVRTQAEQCDNLQSFIFINSFGGGTGSGFSAYLGGVLQDSYPEAYRFSIGTIPCINDDVITSPYNSVFSLGKLSKSVDAIIPIDNQQLLKIYNSIKSQKNVQSSLIEVEPKKLYSAPKRNEAFDTMNNIVANLLLNMTSSMRFDGSMNVDINDILTNLIPFPSLNFICSSMAPLTVPSDATVKPKMIDQMFNLAYSPDSQLLPINSKQSVYLASLCICRGSIYISDLRRNIDRIRETLHFVPWNRDAWKTGLCKVPPLNQKYSLLSLSNNSSVHLSLNALKKRFNLLFRRKAHLHHYIEFGMEMDEMRACSKQLDEVIAGYVDLETKYL